MMHARSLGKRSRVILFGKLPPPFIGPAIATRILLGSELKMYYELHHINTMLHVSLKSFGHFEFRRVFRNLGLYIHYHNMLRRIHPQLAIIPISQTGLGFLKDTPFILLSWYSGARVIVQLRGSEFRDWYARSNAVIQRLVAGVLRRVHGAVVLGDGLRWIFQGLIADDRIFVIPNGANYAAIRNKKRSGRRILYLSNLQPSKGIEDLVTACEDLSRDGCEYELVISGAWWDGETRRKVEQLIDTRKIQACYVGVSEDDESKFALLSEADIFVFPPRSPEGHPWVLVEAMAAGLPIIATDKGAIADSVRDGENGFIVPSHRPDAIAEKLAMLLADNDLRKRMGKRSSQLYEENFTENKMVQRWRDVIETVLAKN